MVYSRVIINFLVGVIYLSIVSCNQNSDKIGMLIASPVFEPDLANFSAIISRAGYSVVSANANYDDLLFCTLIFYNHIMPSAFKG